jgi:hypothetical protein
MTASKRSMNSAPTSEGMSERDIALWENDVSNLMGDESFRRRVTEGLFRYLRSENLSPEQAFPHPSSSEKRNEYRAWIERGESDATDVS